MDCFCEKLMSVVKISEGKTIYIRGFNFDNLEPCDECTIEVIRTSLLSEYRQS